jgi:D-beta-D-heptose 7-phosphate kinase/D-beta-D-heptose 1-phosphate adenosyltransferase
VLVIGDVMLDHYITGAVERISPEAPVPILRVTGEFDRLGGAANVAANIAELGAAATLVAYVGAAPDSANSSDATGAALLDRCQRRRIATTLIPALARTTRKTRLLADHQQMLRVDWEDGAVAPDARTRREKIIAEILPTVDLVLLSDYAKGMIDAELMAQLRGAGKKIIIDPRPQNRELYYGATVLTPNRKEALAMLDQPRGLTDAELGLRLGEKLAAHILVTLGEDGMCLCELGKAPLFIRTRAKEVFDVTGAGDTVAATLALALGAGYSLADSAQIANAAAGVVVGHIGAVAITPAELRVAL